MKIVVTAGVFVLCLIVFIMGSYVPDTTSATTLSFIARKAEDAKREAILNSPEVQMLEIEIEELEAKLASYEVACPSPPDAEDGRDLMVMFGKIWPW